MLVRAQVSARRRVISILPINVSLFTTSVGDGATSIDETAQTITVTYGTTATARRGVVPVTIGKRYRVSWVYGGATNGSLYAGTTLGGLQYRAAIVNDTFFDFTAIAAELHLSFQRTTTGTTTVSSLTIQEIPEVTWTDTSLITPAGWVQLGTGVTVDQTTGAITIPATGSVLSARQSVTTTVNKLYRLRWNNSIASQCLIGTTNGGQQMKTASSSDSAGDRTYEFRATTTTTWIQFQRATAGTVVISNIFVQETA